MRHRLPSALLRLVSRHPSERALMALHDGEVAEPEASRLRSHADSCARCRAWLSDLDRVGAVARGEVVPVVTPVLARRTLPPVAVRTIPALAASIAVVVGLVATDASDDRSQEVATAGSVPGIATPPPAGASDVRGATGGPGGAAASGDAAGAGTAPSQPNAASPAPNDAGVVAPPGGGVAATDPDAEEPLRLGVLVPADDPGSAAVVKAVRAAAAATDPAAEVVVGDTADPDSVDLLARRGVRALVGGYGAPPTLHSRAVSLGLPWFGPTDVTDVAGSVLPFEVPHRTAGSLLATFAEAAGADRAFALVGSSPERRLADGVGDVLPTDRAVVPAKSDCKSDLPHGAAGADVVVLALDPAGVSACLAAFGGSAPGPLMVLIPSTAVDAVTGSSGAPVVVATGAPLADDRDDAGAARFRRVTGVTSYRALVSFAATEVALHALASDPDEPLDAFRKGGAYRTDLVHLDPSTDPVTRGVAVREVGTGGPAASNSDG